MKIKYCTYILHFLYNIAQIKTPSCKNKISEIKLIKLKNRIIKENITIIYKYIKMLQNGRIVKKCIYL